MFDDKSQYHVWPLATLRQLYQPLHEVRLKLNAIITHGLSELYLSITKADHLEKLVSCAIYWHMQGIRCLRLLCLYNGSGVLSESHANRV